MIQESLRIRKGNIYFANIKFIDTGEVKERPVIVLKISGISVIVIPLTSNTKRIYDTDIVLKLNNKVSVAKVSNIQRIHVSDIKRHLIIYNEEGDSYAKLSSVQRKEVQLKISLFLCN